MKVDVLGNGGDVTRHHSVTRHLGLVVEEVVRSLPGQGGRRRHPLAVVLVVWESLHFCWPHLQEGGTMEERSGAYREELQDTELLEVTGEQGIIHCDERTLPFLIYLFP